MAKKNTITLNDPARTMKAALKFASKDYSRPILCTVHLDECGDIVSTDSYRLFMRHNAWSGGNLTIERTLAEDVAKWGVKVKTAAVEVDGNVVTFIADDKRKAVGNIVEGKYPNYHALCGGKVNSVARFEPKLVTPILKECKRNKIDAVVFDFVGGDLNVHPDGEETPSATLNGATSGTPVRVGFNPAYVLPALECFKGEVELRVEKSLKAAAIVQGDAEVLVMPVKLASYELPAPKAEPEIVVTTARIDITPEGVKATPIESHVERVEKPAKPKVKPQPPKRKKATAAKPKAEPKPKAAKAKPKKAAKPKAEPKTIVVTIKGIEKWAKAYEGVRVEQRGAGNSLWVYGVTKAHKGAQDELKKAGFAWAPKAKHGAGWWAKPTA